MSATVTEPRKLLTIGQISQAVGEFESRVRRLLRGRPDLVVWAGQCRCIEAGSLDAVREALGQTAKGKP